MLDARGDPEGLAMTPVSGSPAPAEPRPFLTFEEAARATRELIVAGHDPACIAIVPIDAVEANAGRPPTPRPVAFLVRRLRRSGGDRRGQDVPTVKAYQVVVHDVISGDRPQDCRGNAPRVGFD